MMNRASSAAVAALLLGAGCGYQSETERAFFQERDAERLQRQEQLQLVTAAVPEEEVLGLVQDHEMADGSGAAGDWVIRQVNALGGQHLFPRWQVFRRGANRYEVRFTYTHLDASNTMTRRGYSWSVDAALKLVGEARELDAEEQARPGRTLGRREEDRIRQHEASLE